MNMIPRLVGGLLIAIGAVVAVHMLIEPLYYVSSEASPYSPIWRIIDLFMALAIVLGVSYGYMRKKRAGYEGGEAPITREFLMANMQLYGFVFVGLLFFWNWFNVLNPGFTGAEPEVISIVWTFIDVALPLLSVNLGLHLAEIGKQ